MCYFQQSSGSQKGYLGFVRGEGWHGFAFSRFNTDWIIHGHPTGKGAGCESPFHTAAGAANVQLQGSLLIFSKTSASSCCGEDFTSFYQSKNEWEIPNAPYILLCFCRREGRPKETYWKWPFSHSLRTNKRWMKTDITLASHLTIWNSKIHRINPCTSHCFQM